MRELTTIQLPKDLKELLRKMAAEDHRSVAAQNEWLIIQEWKRRSGEMAYTHDSNYETSTRKS